MHTLARTAPSVRQAWPCAGRSPPRHAPHPLQPDAHARLRPLNAQSRLHAAIEHARAVGRLLRGLPAQVNLIPLNPTSGYAGEPTHSEAAKHFQKILAEEFKLPSTVRQRRGIDIAAGCGQLAVAET